MIIFSIVSILMVGLNQVYIYHVFIEKLVEHELENSRNDMVQYLDVLDLLAYEAFQNIQETLYSMDETALPTDDRILKKLRERYQFVNYVVYDKENTIVGDDQLVTDDLLERYRERLSAYRDREAGHKQIVNLGLNLSKEHHKIMMSVLLLRSGDYKAYIYQFDLTQMLLSSMPLDIYQNINSTFMSKRVAMDDIVITRQKKIIYETLDAEVPELTPSERQALMQKPYVTLKEHGDLKILSLITVERSNWLYPIQVLLTNSYRNNNFLGGYVFTNSLLALGYIILCLLFASLAYKVIRLDLLNRLKVFHEDLHKTIAVNYEAPLSYEGQGLISEIIEDVEHIRIDMQERLMFIDEMSFYDTVTGVGNIYLLEDRLIKLYDAFNPKWQYVLVILEIKNIKALFEGYGVGKMNGVYANVIAELQSVFGHEAVFRKSDYAFAVIYESRPPNHIEVKLKEVREKFKKTNLEIAIEPRFIIATFPEHGETPKDLLQNIEIAQQRLSHQDVVYYSQKIKDEYLNRILLENELERALERHEIQVAYQPIVSPNTNTMKGVEALIRWLPKSNRKIVPDVFIPVAEQMGIIHLLDQFVFEKAISMLQLWSDIYPDDFFVSINCSPKWFTDPDFIGFIQKMLDEYPVDPNQICIEIIETCLIEDIDAANDILLSLKKMGIRVALDDFGKGYSSLNYLRKLHIDKLKIDKDFLQEMTAEIGEYNLIDSIITMAHQMALEVVVEGVEEINQVIYLQALEVELIQGYYYSKPVNRQIISDILLNSANMRLVD